MFIYIRYSLKRDLFAASLSGPIGDFGCDYPAVAERENPGGGKTSGAWFLRGNASMGRVNARFINQPLGPDVVRGCGTRMLLPHVGVDVGVFWGSPLYHYMLCTLWVSAPRRSGRLTPLIR